MCLRKVSGVMGCGKVEVMDSAPQVAQGSRLEEIPPSHCFAFRSSWASWAWGLGRRDWIIAQSLTALTRKWSVSLCSHFTGQFMSDCPANSARAETFSLSRVWQQFGWKLSNVHHTYEGGPKRSSEHSFNTSLPDVFNHVLFTQVVTLRSALSQFWY